MSVAPISSASFTIPVTPVRPVASSASQAPPATDNDGDGDKGAPDVRASTPPGVGEKLDLKV